MDDLSPSDLKINLHSQRANTPAWHAAGRGSPAVASNAPPTLVQLSREPPNPQDGRAGAVQFGGRRIGSLPRIENAAIRVRQLIDRSEALSAHISILRLDCDPWQRLDVTVELGV